LPILRGKFKTKRLGLSLLIFFVCLASLLANDNDLLNDYNLLYIDLSNIKTYGYKSFYDSELNRSNENINISQGALQVTENPFDCAIHGEGFFKIRLENDLIGYTRSGNFKVNEDGLIVTAEDYPLFDEICLGEAFLPETLEITRDHNVTIKQIRQGIEEEIEAGKLLTYKIPVEILEYYKDAIYIIKDGIEYAETITFDNNIMHKMLELSNYGLLPVVLRMYYILSILSEDVIPNINFKKELLKILIERLADNNNAFDKAIFALNGQLKSMYEILKDSGLTENEEEITITDGLLKGHTLRFTKFIFLYDGDRIVEEYLNAKLNYLEAILPFIRYDY
jgi:flagellar basal body rod protein FlgF